jgi:hypothetical protein
MIAIFIRMFLVTGLLQLVLMWARRQPIGTKSVLYGAHCFLYHWIFVARGWWKLYGFRRVHIGDVVTHHPVNSIEALNLQPGTTGVTLRRPVFASLADPRLWVAFFVHDLGYVGKPNMDGEEGETHPEWACRFMNRYFGAPWGAFVLTHSRFYAKRMKLPLSPLCYADKLAITMQPAWLYLPSVRLTGEIKEYMKMARANSNGSVSGDDERRWYREMQAYVVKWVEEHKDGRADVWTSDRKASESGVWS